MVTSHFFKVLFHCFITLNSIALLKLNLTSLLKHLTTMKTVSYFFIRFQFHPCTHTHTHSNSTPKRTLDYKILVLLWWSHNSKNVANKERERERERADERARARVSGLWLVNKTTAICVLNVIVNVNHTIQTISERICKLCRLFDRKTCVGVCVCVYF